MRHYADVLVRPWITEKGLAYSESGNTYPFEVQGHANKIEIKRAVEARYGVKVTGVRTLVVPGKPRRSRRNQPTNTRERKKALVTLAEGDAIDLM